VYRPERQDLRGQAELILAKQRNGPTGVVKLVFLKHCTRFENTTSDAFGEESAPPPVEEE
jgi:replicative DNA helicase